LVSPTPDLGADVSSAIYIIFTRRLKNTILDNSVTNNADYRIYEQDLSNCSRTIGNILTSNTLGASSLTGTYDIVENNVGLWTDNRGATASCINGASKAYDSAGTPMGIVNSAR
jgi:hypothetical protein